MSIWFPVIFTTALYVIIAYGINKENAKYLLAGYNTLSEKERTKFDIVEYLKFFKAFLSIGRLYLFAFWGFPMGLGFPHRLADLGHRSRATTALFVVQGATI